MDDGGEVALDHCLPSTISWPAGEAGMEGKKHLTPSQGTKKSLSKGIFLLLHVLSGGVSKKISMSHSSHMHTQQLIFLRRNGKARTAAISIAKGKPQQNTLTSSLFRKSRWTRKGWKRKGKEEKKAVS